jgi:hypothetical protein
LSPRQCFQTTAFKTILITGCIAAGITDKNLPLIEKRQFPGKLNMSRKKVMMTLGIPEGHKLLLWQLGRLAIAHGNLEMVQIMCLKILEKLEPDEAVRKYRKTQAWKIRKKIFDHIESSSLTADDKEAIGKLINEARDLSDQRNSLLHRFWGTIDGKWLTSPDEAKWEPLPNHAVIQDLTGRIQAITRRINYGRMKGKILQASKSVISPSHRASTSGKA